MILGLKILKSRGWDKIAVEEIATVYLILHFGMFES